MSALLADELLWLAEVGGSLRFYSDDANQEGCVITVPKPGESGNISANPQWQADLQYETRMAAVENELPYWIGAVRGLYENE